MTKVYEDLQMIKERFDARGWEMPEIVEVTYAEFVESLACHELTIDNQNVYVILGCKLSLYDKELDTARGKEHLLIPMNNDGVQNEAQMSPMQR